MLINNEIKVFIKWVVKWNLHTYIRFFINKIWIYISRYMNSYINNYSYNYPSSVQKKFYKKCQFSVEKVIRFSSKKINITSIRLAGTNLSISNNMVDWSKNLTDSEDEESLHRWNWSIYNLSSISEKDKLGLVFWTQKQHESWIEKFQKEISDNATSNQLRWESYTVSERVSNSVIFYHLTLGGWPSVDISNALKEQVYFLIKNLEYFGKNTGNHVINNARAIYLAGVSFDCPEWRELAFFIIERELPVLITEDGFLREGSSHYQFLFTRWMLEISYFSSIVNDKKMRELLSLYVKSLIKQCNFFLVYDKTICKWSIPLFGDISPDFQPEWLLALPWSNLADQPPCLLEQYKITNDSWNSLWISKYINKTDDKLCANRYKINMISNHPESGWFRGGVKGTVIFMRVDKKLIPEYVGHHHHDMYHFCLYYKGQPILVDSGRLNYKYKGLWSEFGISTHAHNSILIDGIGTIPKRSRSYPIEYTQANNRVDFLKKENLIRYILSSSCFKRIDPDLSVSRSITLSENKCLVNDIFYGTGEHLIESFFHWGVDVDISRISKNVWSINFGTHVGHFKIVRAHSLKSSFYDGGRLPLGWVVDKYGEKKSSSTLQFKGLVCFPVTIKYELTWSV